MNEGWAIKGDRRFWDEYDCMAEKLGEGCLMIRETEEDARFTLSIIGRDGESESEKDNARVVRVRWELVEEPVTGEGGNR